MKILIAPDSFKGSLSAQEVANSIERGMRKVYPSAEIFKIPMADGGEGTIEAILAVKQGKKMAIQAKNPLGKEISASYAILEEENTAIIEMATASGLPLLALEERNPLKTTTFGTGQLIKDALQNLSDTSQATVVVCIGGSATNDGGAGVLQALGVHFLDKNGKKIEVCGGNLKEIKEIDISNFHKPKHIEFVVACDVTNPLLGENGASAVFAPQKGADLEKVQILEENLTYFADLVESTFPHLKGLQNRQGTGAAGGLGYGMMAFLQAKMQKGVEIVLEITQLERIIEKFSPQNRDLVITGEGAMDFQTIFGKVPWGVAKLAKQYQLPVIGIAGTLGKEHHILYQHGFDSLFSIVNKPMSLQEAMNQADILLEHTAERVMRLYLL
jgi:glycerate kinase